MVSALCLGEQRWIMHVPARRDEDPDLVIADGLSAGEEAAARIEELEKALKEAQAKAMTPGQARIFWEGPT